MKKLVLFFVSALFASCGPSADTAIKKAAFQWDVVYYKDTTVNVCFGMLKYGKEANTVDYKTFTCVPCDSLKNVSIYKIGN